MFLSLYTNFQFDYLHKIWYNIYVTRLKKPTNHRKESYYDSWKHHRLNIHYSNCTNSYRLHRHSLEVAHQAGGWFGAGVHCTRHSD